MWSSTRRDTRLALVLIAGLLISACATNVQGYPIQEGRFSLDVPEGWQVGEYDEESQV